MYKFKVAEGNHVQGGKVYTKGDVVESDLDLIKLFPQKFLLVQEQKAPAAPKVVVKEDDDDDEEYVEEVPEKAPAPKPIIPALKPKVTIPVKKVQAQKGR